MSKKMIALIVAAAVILIGGAVSAFFFLNLSPKEQYFLAEKRSMEFISEQFEDQFQKERDWAEHARSHPIEQSFTVSAEYNDPFELFADRTTQQMINNSSFTINGAVDLENQVISTELQTLISDIELSGLSVYLTNENVMLELPFLDEVLHINEANLNKFLNEMDPYTFPDDETFKFETLFEQMSGTAIEEDWEYLKSEYGEFLYEELPEKAFTAESDTITVGNEDVKVDKISMNLSEEDVKTLLHSLIDKLQNDDTLKEIIERHLSTQLGSQGVETSELLQEFENSLQLAKDRLDTHVSFPNGITSTIWTQDNLIVQREFSIEFGPSENDVVQFTINGTQQLKNNQQIFDYDIGFADDAMEAALNLNADFTIEDDTATDSLTLSMDGITLTYNGTETEEGSTIDFEREIGLDVNVGFERYGGSLIWSGQSTYENDQMNAEHQLSLDVEGLQPDMFQLIIQSNAKTINEVSIPDDKPMKDIGEMNEVELGEYIETEIMPQFEEWMLGTFGGFMGEF